MDEQELPDHKSRPDCLRELDAEDDQYHLHNHGGQRNFSLEPGAEHDRRRIALQQIEATKKCIEVESCPTRMRCAWQALRKARSVGEQPPEWALHAGELASFNDVLAFIHPDFLATNNPMYALEAYDLARAIGMPPPEWVLEFFDKGIGDFLKAFNSFQRDPATHQNDPPRSWAEAFGFIRKGPTIWSQHARNRFQGWNKSRGQMDLSYTILDVLRSRLIRGQRVNISGAVAETAAKCSVSEQAAWRAWNQLKKSYPELKEAAASGDEEEIREFLDGFCRARGIPGLRASE